MQEDSKTYWHMQRRAQENRQAYWRGMGLSTRAINGLLNNDILTLDQLKNVDYIALMRTPNFGVKSLREIAEKTGYPLDRRTIPDLPFTDERLILELNKRGYAVGKVAKG